MICGRSLMTFERANICHVYDNRNFLDGLNNPMEIQLSILSRSDISQGLDLWYLRNIRHAIEMGTKEIFNEI